MRTKEKIMQDIADEDFYKERVIYCCICEVLIDIRDILDETCQQYESDEIKVRKFKINVKKLKGK